MTLNDAVVAAMTELEISELPPLMGNVDGIEDYMFLECVAAHLGDGLSQHIPLTYSDVLAVWQLGK